MGWCSGTDVFDDMVKEILALPLTDEQIVDLLVVLIKALWRGDWDCEWDSEYIDSRIVKEAFIKADPVWAVHFRGD